jgi:hypothetical protein
MSELTIAFVHPPTSNEFMAEILIAVSEEVAQVGVRTRFHRGTVDEIDDGEMAFVVIPHEYFWFNPRPSADRLLRTIALGVEHPGTETFEVATRAAGVMAAVFEISEESVRVLAGRGMRSELFVLGYHDRWDRWGGSDSERPIDVAYMAAADPERLQVLSSVGPELAAVSTEFLIPPIEQRLGPRPDFLTAETKWRFLSQSKLLLNLHRQAKTALELVRTVEAMCNGCVVLTEPSTAIGGLEPGRHLLFAPRETIAAAARRALDDPEGLRSVRQEAYDYCRTALSMGPSAERLAAVAEDVVRVALARSPGTPLVMPDWPEVRPPHVPELSFWVPETYSLPARGTEPPEPLRSELAQLATRRREQMALHEIHELRPSLADVDVIIVLHGASGSWERTVHSLERQDVATNVHIAGLGLGKPGHDTPLNTYLTCTQSTSIGAARNELIERSTAAHLLVLEAGDELLGQALQAMLTRLQDDPDVVLSYPMAALGQQTLVNLFHPEAHRLARFNYLTRGYLVRRAWLEDTGKFAEDPVLDAYVDYDLWLRLTLSGVPVAHIHQIGARLWPIDPARMIPADPSEILGLLTQRAAAAV